MSLYKILQLRNTVTHFQDSHLKKTDKLIKPLLNNSHLDSVFGNTIQEGKKILRALVWETRQRSLIGVRRFLPYFTSLKHAIRMLKGSKLGFWKFLVSEICHPKKTRPQGQKICYFWRLETLWCKQHIEHFLVSRRLLTVGFYWIEL